MSWKWRSVDHLHKELVAWRFHPLFVVSLNKLFLQIIHCYIRCDIMLRPCRKKSSNALYSKLESCRLKSPASQLLVQKFAQTSNSNNNKHESSTSLCLCEGSPQLAGGIPTERASDVVSGTDPEIGLIRFISSGPQLTRCFCGISFFYLGLNRVMNNNQVNAFSS